MLSAVGIGQQRRQGCLWVGFRGNGMVWCGGGGLVEVVGEGGKEGGEGEGKGRGEKRGKGGREREEKRVI